MGCCGPAKHSLGYGLAAASGWGPSRSHRRSTLSFSSIAGVAQRTRSGNRLSNTCRSRGQSATLAAPGHGSCARRMLAMASAAENASQSCTPAAICSHVVGAVGWPTRASRRTRGIAPSAKRRSSGCASAAAQASSTPFTEKPPRMHRLTYYRLSAKAMTAQEHSLGLDIEYLRRHFPGFLHNENVGGK